MIRLLLTILHPLVTFPGVVAHEAGHQVACWLTGTRVREVCYFRLANPPGFVLHDRPTALWRHLVIALGPLLFCSAAAWGLGNLARGGHAWIHSRLVTRLLITWLALALGSHALPSLGDAGAFWDHLWVKGKSWLARLLALPFALGLFLLAWAHRVSLHWAWAVLLVFGEDLLRAAGRWGLYRP